MIRVAFQTSIRFSLTRKSHSGFGARMARGPADTTSQTPFSMSMALGRADYRGQLQKPNTFSRLALLLSGVIGFFR